jgi:hypothetical protein
MCILRIGRLFGYASVRSAPRRCLVASSRSPSWRLRLSRLAGMGAPTGLSSGQCSRSFQQRRTGFRGTMMRDMDAATFDSRKQRRLIPQEELIELIDASDLPANERRTLLAFVEAADQQQSMPNHPRFEPYWRQAMGEPPWPSRYEDYYWPSLDAIAFQAGITTSTARRHIGLLQGHGVLVLLHETNHWVPEFGFRGPATYVVNLRMLKPKTVVVMERPRHEQSIFRNSL